MAEEQDVAEGYSLEKLEVRDAVVGERKVVAWRLDSNEAKLFVVVPRGDFDLTCLDFVVKQHFPVVEIGSEKNLSFATDVEMVVNSEMRVDSAVERSSVVAAAFAERIDCLSVAEKAGMGTDFAEVAEDVS